VVADPSLCLRDPEEGFPQLRSGVKALNPEVSETMSQTLDERRRKIGTPALDRAEVREEVLVRAV
jgi:hypothetical protein